MTKICKYPVETHGLITTITGPIAKILCIKNQPGQGIYAWIELESNFKEVDLNIVSVGTEQEMSDEERENVWYIDSVIDNGEEWHFYRSTRRPVDERAIAYNFEVGF